MPYECDICSGERPVAIVITPLAGGDTMATCADDMPVTLAGMLAGSLGIDGDQLYAAVQGLVAARDLAQEAAEATAAAAQATHKGQVRAGGKRPTRPSRQAARTAAAAPADGGGGPAAPAGGEPQ